jgi:hypothetical protein
MLNCSQLRGLDLRHLVSLESWEGDAFVGCSGLEQEIDMSPVTAAAEAYALELRTLLAQRGW